MFKCYCPEESPRVMVLPEQALDGQHLGTSMETHSLASPQTPESEAAGARQPVCSQTFDHSHARKAGESLIQGNWLRMQTVRPQLEMASQLAFGVFFLGGAGPEHQHFTSSLYGDIMLYLHLALHPLQRVLFRLYVQAFSSEKRGHFQLALLWQSPGSLLTQACSCRHQSYPHVLCGNAEREETSFSSTLHRPNGSPVPSCKRRSTTT